MLAPHNTHPWFFLHKTWCQFCSTVNMLAYTYLAMQLEFGWKNQTWISNINHFKWIAGDDGIGKISLEYHGDSIQYIPMIFQWYSNEIFPWYHGIIILYGFIHMNTMIETIWLYHGSSPGSAAPNPAPKATPAAGQDATCLAACVPAAEGGSSSVVARRNVTAWLFGLKAKDEKRIEKPELSRNASDTIIKYHQPSNFNQDKCCITEIHDECLIHEWKLTTIIEFNQLRYFLTSPSTVPWLL